MFFSTVIVVLLFIIDRLLKLYLTELLAGGTTIPLVSGIIQLYYSENRGAAFSILSGHRTLLIIVTGIGLLAMVGFLFFYKFKKDFARWALVLIVAGGIGNLYDRIFSGFVVDYFELLFMNFAIFNFADCLINVGAALLFIYLIFFEWREPKKINEPKMDDWECE